MKMKNAAASESEETDADEVCNSETCVRPSGKCPLSITLCFEHYDHFRVSFFIIEPNQLNYFVVPLNSFICFH